MTRIQSMEDLVRAKAEALERQRADAIVHRFHIRVGMASCGIAAGARDTLYAINHLIATGSIPGVSASEIRVSQIGCIGLCALEPLLQVQVSDQPLVTYGKVTPEIAHRILSDHIGKGLIVQQYVVENI
jgi:NADP-reducing hydrogenase subunit HndB